MNFYVKFLNLNKGSWMKIEVIMKLWWNDVIGVDQDMNNSNNK